MFKAPQPQPEEPTQPMEIVTEASNATNEHFEENQQSFETQAQPSNTLNLSEDNKKLELDVQLTNRTSNEDENLQLKTQASPNLSQDITISTSLTGTSGSTLQQQTKNNANESTYTEKSTTPETFSQVDAANSLNKEEELQTNLKTKEKNEIILSTSQKCKLNNKETKIHSKNMNKRTTIKDLSKELNQAETLNNAFTQIMTYNSKESIKDNIQPLISASVNKESSLESGIANSSSVPTLSSDEKVDLPNASTPSIAQPSENDNENKSLPDLETKVSTNATFTSVAAKRTSKIPIRRTASNKSLINSQQILAKTILNVEQKPYEITADQTEISKSPSKTDNFKNIPTDDDGSEHEELYSIASDTSATEVASRTDEVQSPTSTSEMFLMIQQVGTENSSTIAPSTSSSTLHSIISQSSGLKSPTEFIPSGDPSKQNLSELVKDTQRLIKQMKDEISIDDFESSTDEDADEYTDEYSDEYDDGEEEEEDEDWEGEEEDEGDNDEYDDITEDITEENDILSIEGASISNTQSPLPPQESQDHREIHNNSVLSNATVSSDHSQTLLLDHFENEVSTNNTQILVEETAAFVETENNIAEFPVETVISNFSEKLPSSSMEVIESENTLPEMPVEIVLLDSKPLNTQYESKIQHDSEEKTSLVKDLPNVISAPISVVNDLETENVISELPVETVWVEINDFRLPSPLPGVEDSITISEHTPTTQTEDDLPTSSKKVTPSANTKLHKHFTSTEYDLPLKSNKNATSAETPQRETSAETTKPQEIGETVEPNNGLTLESSTTIELASADTTRILKKDNTSPTSNKISSFESIQNNNPATSSKVPEDNLPSTSKGIRSSETKKSTSTEPKALGKKSLAASKIPKPKEIAKQPKPKETQNGFNKKKVTVRSKSFSGPPTPIGIASVKTISQRFISPNPNELQSASIKKHPTVTRKSSITEAINKFTKSYTNAEKPTTSSLLFKSRTQPRIPKKKYHETCFSDDDYQTSSSEEEMEPLDVRQRKLSVPVFRTYPSVVAQEPEHINTEELVEKFVTEELTATIAEAQIAAALVSMKFQQDVSLWAAKECSDLDHAIALLKQECELCSGTYALNQIVSMLKCTHKCCKQCAKTYFTVQITERSINDCSCPFCKLPDLHNQIEHEDEILEYFSNLDIFLKNILEPEVHELFQRKLRDRTLLKDPNFKWCVQCSSGFFARPKQKRLICPDCGSVTCGLCRKPWQKQHEGISCDHYSEWESANDPEVQAKGVQQHLDKNGIDCPKCKFRYSLARGGCMHFTCTQCKYEFCYGCAKPFMMGAKCTISSYCAKLGLHAHHPRNCLFYLRDKLPVQLQILLKNNGVTFEVDPIEIANDDAEPRSSKKKDLLCPIPLQKETPTGLVDARCNSEVPDQHAGMCRTHYVEYLTAKVAKAKIDPLPIFDLTDCVQELRRRGIALPERGPWDTDEIYKNMCAEVIQKNIPLDVA